MPWIQHPIRLDGQHALLTPLEYLHFNELINVSHDPRIWEFMPVMGHDPATLRNALEQAMEARNKNERYPFVIIDKASNKVIGSTSYLKINPEYKSLEIGWTWYHPDYWGTGVNEECKLMLLTHCFETLGTIRVEIITWDKNLRSRKAIERIGGQLEGIRRNAAIRYNGKRNSVIYSIIDEEWPATKVKLTDLKNQRYQQLKTR
ncbi:GNAT family N-acetyltransferase [Chitinophaga arvensicola]|uniref:Protein N-acetyltransferase, RimJ/RimL family n=1 Tax=Chitinophaga arvensicola TaxID=29529 RepID=A0A1I0RDJ6_9BACT|nr:GNAT family protein [Chitinophaga arvensicola]SEW38873.1 Protein N-acetyltransferase, RimJ/RimL family [Chitinophaga arvensicola]